MNYPDNSLSSIKKRPEVPKRTDISPVAKGTIKKQTFWGRTAKEFFGNNPEDGGTLGEYIWFGAVIPFVKNGIMDLVGYMLFGQSGYIPRNNIIGARGIGASKVAYSSISTGKVIGQNPQQAQPRMPYDYEQLVYGSYGEADSVLERMFELLDSDYERVTVGDLYDLSQVSPGAYTNCDYGWTNLSGARVVRNFDGTYSLSLPRPRPMK